jgi:hypothetical protein
VGGAEAAPWDPRRTFGRVFGLLAAVFAAFFRAGVGSIRALLLGEIVAIDGKTQQSSHNCGAGLAALHMVSAWATHKRLVLGQVATDAKSNEIAAIPRLVELLHIEGCIMTIDATGFQAEIVHADRRPRPRLAACAQGQPRRAGRGGQGCLHRRPPQVV